jgi:hypothetical protein
MPEPTATTVLALLEPGDLADTYSAQLVAERRAIADALGLLRDAELALRVVGLADLADAAAVLNDRCGDALETRAAFRVAS